MQSEGPPGVRGSRRDPSLLPLVRAAAGWYTTSPTTIVRSQLLWVCRRTMQGRDSQYGVYLVRLPNGSRPKQLLRDHITIVECGGLWGQRWETQSMRASTHAMRLVVSLRTSGIRDQRRGDSLKYECQMRCATWDSKQPFDRRPAAAVLRATGWERGAGGQRPPSKVHSSWLSFGTKKQTICLEPHPALRKAVKPQTSAA